MKTKNEIEQKIKALHTRWLSMAISTACYQFELAQLKAQLKV
jgi:hypothetical protein